MTETKDLMKKSADLTELSARPWHGVRQVADLRSRRIVM